MVAFLKVQRLEVKNHKNLIQINSNKCQHFFIVAEFVKISFIENIYLFSLGLRFCPFSSYLFR